VRLGENGLSIGDTIAARVKFTATPTDMKQSTHVTPASSEFGIATPQTAVNLDSTPLESLQSSPAAKEDATVRKPRSTISIANALTANDRPENAFPAEQVLAAQEDERKRIARELHDETAQALTTLLIRLKILEKARTGRPRN